MHMTGVNWNFMIITHYEEYTVNLSSKFFTDNDVSIYINIEYESWSYGYMNKNV